MLTSRGVLLPLMLVLLCPACSHDYTMARTTNEFMKIEATIRLKWSRLWFSGLDDVLKGSLVIYNTAEEIHCYSNAWLILEGEDIGQARTWISSIASLSIDWDSGISVPPRDSIQVDTYWVFPEKSGAELNKLDLHWEPGENWDFQGCLQN